MKARILLVDDDRLFTEQTASLLAQQDYEITQLNDSTKLLNHLNTNDYELILLDIQMPSVDGVTLLKKILSSEYHPDIIMMSGAASLQQAADSVKYGAVDFIEKPPHVNRLLSVIKNCLENYRLKQENRRLRENTLEQFKIVGSSRTIRELKIKINQASQTDSRVLIWGETGTGKELIANQIHYLSRRFGRPLIKVNCASIPSELAESELFGYKKGAFTGAYKDKAGKFELANDGTLVLDEIADLPLNLQSKLLRLLETQELDRIGDSQIKKIDIRLISICSRNLEDEIKSGKFRDDLYYRINTIPIHVPPLRERQEDIPELFEYFFGKLKTSSGQSEKVFDTEIFPVLYSHRWDGNIRELKNFCERLFFLSTEDKISAKFAESMLSRTKNNNIGTSSSKNMLSQTIENFERNFLEVNLTKHDGNINVLAKQLKMDRGNLYKKLKKYDLL